MVKNQNTETTYQKVIKLYNSGIKDYYTLANMLDIKEGTIKAYISRGRQNGDIEKIDIYKNIVDLYKSGVENFDEIAEKLGIAVSTVNKYIKLAREQNLIEPSKPLYMRVVDTYNSGIEDYEEIANITGTTRNTVQNYILRARKEGLVLAKTHKKNRVKKQLVEQDKISKQKKKKEETEEEKIEREKVLADLEKKRILEQKIKIELIQRVYPSEVAKALGIKTWQVYDYIDNLSEEEAKKLKQDRLKNNPLYGIIVSRKKKAKAQDETDNSVVEKILLDMNFNFIQYQARINLARVYFILGNGKEAEKIINQILHDTSYSRDIREKVKIEFDKVHFENIIIRIRKAYKYGHNMDGTNISYDDLCRTYNVRTGVVVDALGMESIKPKLESEQER